jgi:hypothetical protein
MHLESLFPIESRYYVEADEIESIFNMSARLDVSFEERRAHARALIDLYKWPAAIRIRAVEYLLQGGTTGGLQCSSQLGGQHAAPPQGRDLEA